jgi:UDP-glucose 6-dehydrogenase
MKIDVVGNRICRTGETGTCFAEVELQVTCIDSNKEKYQEIRERETLTIYDPD